MRRRGGGEVRGADGDIAETIPMLLSVQYSVLYEEGYKQNRCD